MNTKLSLRIIPPIILIGGMMKQSIFFHVHLQEPFIRFKRIQDKLRDEAISLFSGT
jgi:hypothetical protein